MDNLETLATSSIQDTGGQQTTQKHNTENYNYDQLGHHQHNLGEPWCS
jgi:hypothetical protein